MTPPERRQTERRKPFVILDSPAALDLMKARKYTGPFIGHAAEGVVKKIEIPNPEGWQS